MEVAISASAASWAQLTEVEAYIQGFVQTGGFAYYYNPDVYGIATFADGNFHPITVQLPQDVLDAAAANYNPAVINQIGVDFGLNPLQADAGADAGPTLATPTSVVLLLDDVWVE
jgi:hypothetical protein